MPSGVHALKVRASSPPMCTFECLCIQAPSLGCTLIAVEEARSTALKGSRQVNACPLTHARTRIPVLPSACVRMQAMPCKGGSVAAPLLARALLGSAHAPPHAQKHVRPEGAHLFSRLS